MINSQRNKKNSSIYFSDAMNKIDESIDYNEYNEINSSDYFKETLYRAEDEVDKMMCSPLMSNYKKYKKPKISINLLKKNKDYLLNKLKWLNEKSKQKMTIDVNKKKKKINLESILKRLNKINSKKVKQSEEKGEEKGDEIKNQITSFNNENSYLPKINTLKTFNIDKTNKINETLVEDGINTERKKLNNEKKNVLLTISNSISNKYSLNNKIKKRNNDVINNNKTKSFYYTQKRKEDIENKKRVESLENKYLNCVKGLETLKLYEQNKEYKYLNAKINNLNKSRDIDSIIPIKDKVMKKFLEENIDALNKDKAARKQEKIMKDYVKLKLKKDPLVQLSEKFAYYNRKPLMTLFNFDDKQIKERYGPLAQLKIKDKKIMRNLDNDNRDKNLLIKRLEEDKIKYQKGGYFIMSKEKDNSIKKKKNRTINFETNYNNEYNNEFFNNIKRIVPYESDQFF